MSPRRAGDQGPVAAWYGRWGTHLVQVIAVGMAVWSVAVTQAGLDDVRAETKARIDETCRISEKKQRDDVDALGQTYRYLSRLSPREMAEPLNRAVLANLPRVIREATTDDAPAYCDEPNVGLPEPDPLLPKRPPNLPSP